MSCQSLIASVEDVDTAIVTLKLSNGALGAIDASRRAVYGYDQRVEIFGSKGMATTENKPITNILYCNEEGLRREKLRHFFLERYEAAFIQEMQVFIDSIRNKTESLVTGEDGLQPVLIGLAAKKSYKEHRPVKVSEIKEIINEK